MIVIILAVIGQIQRQYDGVNRQIDDNSRTQLGLVLCANWRYHFQNKLNFFQWVAMFKCRKICFILAALLFMGLMFSDSAKADTRAPLSVDQSPSASMSAAPKPIPDLEPQLTQQVRTLLLQYADGSLPEQSFTEKARALMFPMAVQEKGAEITLYGTLIDLQLLARKVDGEDRNYRYRARYSKESVLVDIHFNKGGKVDYLQIIPE
jgi:hypothetical protein